jgi:hypothetical protein
MTSEKVYSVSGTVAQWKRMQQSYLFEGGLYAFIGLAFAYFLVG